MTGFFRSLFGSKKSISKIKPRMQTRRLELLGLEERITPVAQTLVDFTTNTGVLSLTSDAASFSVVANANGTLTVNSASDVSAGSSTTVTVTRIGTTNDYTVSVNSGPGNVKELSLIGDSNNNNITVSGIDSSAFNADFGLNVDTSTGTDILSINGLVALKGTGALTTAGIEILNIAATGDISTMAGAVNLVSGTINAAGDVSTGSGNISYTGNFNSNGNVAINSVSGNLSLVFVNLGSNNLTIDTGSGSVGIRYVGATTGNLSITTTNTTTSAISILGFSGVGISSQGSVDLKAGGNISVNGDVTAASVNAKSTAGDVSFANRVTTTQVGGFTSETSDATKAIKISNTIDVGAGANALIKGNLITNTSGSKLQTTGAGNITITGNVDASASGNNLTLEAGSGVVTISGNVGSSSTAMGDLTADGSGIFLASGTVVANDIKIGQITRFATSVTFAKAVVTTGTNGIFVDTSGAGTLTFSESITSTNATGVIDLQTVNGNLTVIGAINTKKQVRIDSAAGVVVLSGNITNDGTTIPGTQNGVFISIGSGSLTTSGTITAVGNNAGNGGIQIQSTLSNSSVTINGALSTTGGGAIRLQAGTGSGINQLSVNAPVTTSGTTAGEIIVYANGGSVTLNQPVTVGTAGKILLSTGLSTDTITINSGAAISAGTNIYDTDSGRGYLSAGKINLAANLTTTLGKINLEPVGGITLSGPVSMKAQGTTVGDIILGSINGAQNLTLEATGAIILNNTGQTTALKTVTVTNSDGFATISTFNAANMVLTDSTNTIAFNGSTVISSGLTTAAKAYNVFFGGTTVLSGAPVFLNTGGVSFGASGNGNTTSLTNGATIIGNATSRTNLGGIIVSGGAFNIGTAGDTGIISIANGTQLILNSTSAGSTFANPVAVTAGSQTFNLLGVGSLTLSGDSSANTGDTISVINGTLNVTGKIASTVTSTNGTITGAGGTIGDLTVNTGTVAPGGTLNTGIVTLNAATNYNAAILTNTTASNLKTASAINLNGANLALSSIPTGLAEGDVFTIIDNTAGPGNQVNGIFAGLPERGTLSAIDADGNTVYFAISYVGGTGSNDVTLSVLGVVPQINLPIQPMVAGQPVLNKFSVTGVDAGGGPLVTVTFPDGTYTTFFAYASTFTGGVRVAAADVNGDGSLDIITGPGPGGGPQVNVFSFTPTGSVFLRQSFFAFNTSSFSGGVYVAAGDTNNDGFDDVVIGAGAGGGPRVQVYAGSATGVVTSSTLNDFFAYSPAFTGGVVVAAGDRTGDSFGNQEVITGPASNGGFNVKSFDVNGKGNNPTVVDNFFAFNDMTSIGGLSLASSPFNDGPVQDILIGTTNAQFGVVLDQTGVTSPVTITTNPFPGFTGAIRAGVAIDTDGIRYAVAAVGPGGGPVISLFSVGANSLTQTDSLFVLDPAFTGGLFASS
jgi:hypothetical protein